MRGSATPGTWRILASSLLAKARLAARSEPAICTSMRRRRAEIEDLADDVGRQEGEGRAGKRLRQLLAQGLDIDLGRRRPLVQRDQDVAVEDADRAGIAVGNVDAADRQADVVDDADEPVRRNDRADRSVRPRPPSSVVSSIRVPVGARMWMRIAAESTEGKKSSPRTGARASDASATRDEAAGEPEAVRQRQAQKPHVALAKPFEPALESTLEAGENAGLRRLGDRPPCVA